MPRQIFVNLPVADVKKSIAFFKAIGFSHNPQFTDDNAACIVFTDDIYAMMLSREYFKTFTDLPVSDATKQTEVLTCLSCDSRAAVDELVKKAVAAGATMYRQPQDHGFMYQSGFRDPDGHIWEWIWMDPSFVQKQ